MGLAKQTSGRKGDIHIVGKGADCGDGRQDEVCELKEGIPVQLSEEEQELDNIMDFIAKRAKSETCNKPAQRVFHILFVRIKSFAKSDRHGLRCRAVIGAIEAITRAPLIRLQAFSNNCDCFEKLRSLTEGELIRIDHLKENSPTDMTLLRKSELEVLPIARLPDGPVDWGVFGKTTGLVRIGPVTVTDLRLRRNKPSWIGCGDCEGEEFPCPACPCSKKGLQCCAIATVSDGLSFEKKTFVGFEALRIILGCKSIDMARILSADCPRIDSLLNLDKNFNIFISVDEISSTPELIRVECFEHYSS